MSRERAPGTPDSAQWHDRYLAFLTEQVKFCECYRVRSILLGGVDNNSLNRATMEIGCVE